MSLTVAKLNRVGFSGGGCDVVVANNRRRRGDRCMRDRAKAPGGVSRGAAQRSRRQHRRARGGFAGQRNCRVVPRRRPDVDGRPRHSAQLGVSRDGRRDVAGHVGVSCDSLTALAYRDRATRILADVRGIAELCVAQGRRYRIGVETQPPSSSIPSNTTFGDDGEGVLRRELAAVATRIAEPLFDGFAVHHLGFWRTMPP